MKTADLKKIITQLKDDEHYYGNMGKQFLSNSDISSLLYSPKDFKENVLESKDLLIGRYFHHKFLEPTKAEHTPIIDVASRRTKKYIEAIEETGASMLLLKNEADLVDELYDAMRSQIKFYDLIYDEDNIYESPMVADIMGTGVYWKGKADIIHNDYVIDLKTTSSLKDFPKSVRNFNYDSQAFIYRKLFNKEMLFLVVDKKTKQLGFFPCSESVYERGEMKVEKAEIEYQKFFGDNPTEDVNNYFHYEILY